MVCKYRRCLALSQGQNRIMENLNAPLHVVLGAGQVGTRLAQQLRAQGLRVRAVRRSSEKVAPGIELCAGNIVDLAFAEQALAGASVVYDCMNPSYDKWPELLLPIARGALHGAQKAGAALVALDCLYMYGRPQGAMHERSPLTPCSKKGALRVALAEERFAAHRRGDVRVAVGRASDFFGPDLPLSAFSDRFYQRVLAGKAAECMGDPDQLHSYTYVDDVARALAILGSDERSFGEVWHLPTAAAETTRQLNARLGRALGLDIATMQVPKWLVRGLGLFQPMMRELHEMMYQWDVPYVLDDSKFRATFGVSATPTQVAVEETARWARARYALK
jgi:nucleoside-diphosphate-sugar epimerase